MNKEYNFKEIETKWQEYWDENKYGQSADFDSKPKHYHLVEFPYPSGAGLHVGHCMGYGASDAYCRMKRMQGYNVMYPIGWDAFGLPTENFAIKNKIKPSKATEDNVKTFKQQMKSLGLAFDWNREVNTTDPDYYKWTQWIFLQFYKHAIIDGKLVEVADDDKTTPRLAFQAEMPVNWCPSCKVVLANEEVIAGNCERCGTQSEKRKQKQWMLRITAYAERLIKDLETVDYLEKIKTQQINWIGKSNGALVKFEILNSKPETNSKSQNQNSKQFVEVFTTRPDTLFGCTYLVLSPEHPLIKNIESRISNIEEVEKYVNSAKKKSDLERTELQKEKTGVKIEGISAINPVNNEEIPIYVADYVLSTYGTGAIMAVPAHDERDFEFAKKYSIPIKQVVLEIHGERHENEEPRHTVSLVVKRKSDGKFLAVKWIKEDWAGPVVGGIDKGETPEDAAVREAYEEAGVKVRAVERLGDVVESHFFAAHKNVWRVRYDQPILCELIDEKQEEVSDEEKAIQTSIWLSEDEIIRKITHYDNQIGHIRYFKCNYAFTGTGMAINSDFINDLPTEKAKEKMIEWLKEHHFGEKTVNFKLRDWIFSRQHYWGEPIPIIHCDKCGIVPLSEDQLPLTLPDVEKYEPTDTGESPLAAITDWVDIKCPKCGGLAKRETDTMPNWAGSSWYFLRYCDPQNNTQLAAGDKLRYWTPVDIYNGGMEHTTLHLLYSRFWHKFLYDLKAVPTSEPYAKRIAHGIILGPDGRKMSKSFGNVINPDDIASQYGADTLRAYIMFIGPYDQESAWNTAGVQGVSRFLKRVWMNTNKVKDIEDNKELLIKLNQMIAGVTDDIVSFRLNTYISKLMEMNNMIEKIGHISEKSYQKFLKLLYPAVPHIASELWTILKFENSIEMHEWPKIDSKHLVADETEVVVQVNGKVRDKLIVSSQISDADLEKSALNSPKIKQIIEGKQIVKTIVIPRKLVSIVAK